MLAEIRIDSLGAISAADARFDRGLTVLTGETGTGKTMVVTGLHLLGGARADADRVRSGAARAVVEGRFTTADLDAGFVEHLDAMLEDAGGDRDDDGSIIAVRSVGRDGPSRAALGGRGVPARTLGAFTSRLLTLHGQNDQLRLMRPEEQRAALDRYAETATLVGDYRRLRSRWRAARRDLIDRTDRAREIAQEADRLRFALAEIDEVAPAPGEDEALVADIRRLSELDALRAAADTARTALTGDPDDPGPAGAASAIAAARAALDGAEEPALAGLGPQLGGALSVVAEVAREIGDYLAGLPADASTLEAKLARQAELRTLTRKYAADIDGVLAWADDARRRLEGLDVSEEALAALQAEVDECGGRLAAAAVALTRARTRAARGLATAVTEELAGLAMADAEFTVAVSPLAPPADDPAPLVLPSGERAQAGPDGVDLVEFGFTAHRGNTVLPLAKSASGGELSRVMLALEVVLAASTAGTTMVFDEVDAGVGGRAAVQIGRRLARLARTHQVIVVTHLPQVAAYADTHLVVSATDEGASAVHRLDDEQRVAELARMLAGLGDSDTGRAHARELLQAARGER